MLDDLSHSVGLRRPRHLKARRLAQEHLEERRLLAAATVWADLDGPTTGALNRSLSFRLTGADPIVGSNALFSFWIDWDSNGRFDEIVTGPSGSVVQHTFTSPGTHAARLVAIGPRGQWTSAVSHQVTIDASRPFRVVADPFRANTLNLVWEGTDGDDDVSFINLGGTVTIVQAKRNSVTAQTTHSVSGINGFIQVDARGGNDRIDGTASGGRHLVFTGGAGHDTLLGAASNDHFNGGDGDDLLVGADGKDTLIGGAGNDIIAAQRGDDLLNGDAGRDLLLGGAGGDMIYGGAQEDLLIAGQTTFADQGTLNTDALRAIHREWMSSRTAAQRIANILGTATGTRLNAGNFLKAGVTVFNDDKLDQLVGGDHDDWFLSSRSGTSGAMPVDRVSDQRSGEKISDTAAPAPVLVEQPPVIVRAWAHEAMEIMDRLQAQGLTAEELPFDGFQIMARHTDPYDANHKSGVKAAAAAVKRALDMGLAKSGAGLALFPQEGEWTSVTAWTEWKNELRALRQALNALGVRNEYVFGLDIEDYPIGNPARPPESSLDAQMLEATAMARAAVLSGFRAEFQASFGHTLRMVYPAGRVPLFNQEIAAAIVMQANALGDEYSFLLANALLNGEMIDERAWQGVYRHQAQFVASLGFQEVVGAKSSLLQRQNATEWQRFLALSRPEVVFMHLDDADTFGSDW